MLVTVLGVGLVITIIGYISDALLYSFVFNKGTDHLVDMTKEEAKQQMGRLMGTAFIYTLIYGVAFAWFYALVRSSLAAGVFGGVFFGLLVWLVAVVPLQLNSANFYGKLKAVSVANVSASLVKLLLSGIAAALLIK